MVMNVESSLVIIDLIVVICKYGRLFLHAVLNCAVDLLHLFTIITFIHHLIITFIHHLNLSLSCRKV